MRIRGRGSGDTSSISLTIPSGANEVHAACWTPGSAAIRSRARGRRRDAAPSVALSPRRCRCQKQTLWVEAQVDVAGAVEAAEKEAAADEQRERQRHLGDDEPVPEAPACSTGSTPPPLFRLCEIRATGEERRRQAGGETGRAASRTP